MTRAPAGLESMPREASVATLKSLTNIRVVRAPGTSEGWTFALDRFPG